MAKVTIAGNSYVITSTVSREDLETVKKYCPSALTITDAETKETLFKVGLGPDSLSDYGINFGGVSNDDAKMATATLHIPPDVEDKTEYVLDKAVMSLVNLDKIETGIAKVLEDIRIQRDYIIESITVSV